MNKPSLKSGSILCSLLISLTLQHHPDLWSGEHEHAPRSTLMKILSPLATRAKRESFAGDLCASSALKTMLLQTLSGV